MKKQYQKPQIYTEDVSIAFAQNCCPETYPMPNAFAAGFCAASGCHSNPGNYLKC